MRRLLCILSTKWVRPSGSQVSGLCSTAKYPIESRNKRIKPTLITDYSASPQRRFKMVQNKSVKRAGHYRYYGVTFQYGAKQTLGMLDLVTYRYSTDFGTHKTDNHLFRSQPLGTGHRGTGFDRHKCLLTMNDFVQ